MSRSDSGKMQAMTNNASVGANSANASGGKDANSGPQKTRKHRRTASQIRKDFTCMHCDKRYGSEAAAIMHMRQKHDEGTKQEIERKKGIRVHDKLLCKPTRGATDSSSSGGLRGSDREKDNESIAGLRGHLPITAPISNPSEL